MKLNSAEPKARVELSVVAVAFVIAGSFAFLPMEAKAKRPSFQMPVQDQLTEGASPASPAVAPLKHQSLAPVGLNDSETAETPVEDSTSGSVLKSSVSENKYVAKDQAGTGANAADSKATSVVGKKELSEKVLKDSWKKVEVAPLALMESDSELEKKVEVTVDAERRQLADLWNATMARNPDIQFVINKLQPTDNQNHAMANTMKTLSAALFGAMNMAPMMIPGAMTGGNYGAVMGTAAGSNLIQSLFQSKSEKDAKKHAISQEQATILYKIIRDTADKLMVNYRDYKKDLSFLERASTDLQDLQAMVAEARGSQDAAKQVEMEYTLRKARREIDRESEEVRGNRQMLVDLAGDEAVVKLDQELQSEREAIARLTGGQDATATAESTTGGSSITTFVNPLSGEPAKRTAATQGAQIH